MDRRCVHRLSLHGSENCKAHRGLRGDGGSDPLPCAIYGKDRQQAVCREDWRHNGADQHHQHHDAVSGHRKTRGGHPRRPCRRDHCAADHADRRADHQSKIPRPHSLLPDKNRQERQALQNV